jgi:Kef-type K+ transport system membrane component KefB
LTDDVLLTLSLLLIAALTARLLASILRVPEILLLVALGALLDPSVLDVVHVPFESLGAQLMFTLGVSPILFYGGLNLSLPLLRKVWVTLGTPFRVCSSRRRSLAVPPTLHSTSSGPARCSWGRSSRRPTRRS